MAALESVLAALKASQPARISLADIEAAKRSEAYTRLRRSLESEA